MKRILTWHVPMIRGDADSQGAIYYAERDYTAGAIRLAARQAPIAGDMQVDIRADGVSLLNGGSRATLNIGATLEEHAEDYPSGVPEIAEGSVVTFHIISSGGAEDITGHLEMIAAADDDDLETDDGDEDAGD